MLEITLHAAGLAVQKMPDEGALMSFQSQNGVIVNIPLTAQAVDQLIALLSAEKIQVANGSHLHLAKK